MQNLFLLCCLLVSSIATAAHPPWLSKSLLGSPDPPLAAQATPVFTNLSIEQPIGLIDLPGRDLRLVVETRGRIRVFGKQDSDPIAAVEILDLSQYENNVAAIRDATLDPNFDQNGYVYLVWGIRPAFIDGGTRVSRFTIPTTNPPTIDWESRLDVFAYPSGDHVGASLRFGPDGLLYIGTGDGSGPNPPDMQRTAQNLADVRGSILRIDVRGATPAQPYRVPLDNPFVDRPGARPEIFSFGVRNAFRIEFDPVLGNLWIADVGWVRCEMLHHSFAGANHGWSVYEGPHEVDVNQVRGPGEIVKPAIVLPRSEAQSITGGVFQSGFAELFPGQYLFGDFMNGAVWAADLSNPQSVSYQKIADTKGKVVSFTQVTLAGEDQPVPIVIDHRGRFLKLQPAPEVDNRDSNPFPQLLSETGLFQSTLTLEPAEGAVRYQPAATMWRDGATGDRVAAIPTEEPIKAVASRRGYQYPDGTVFANTLSQTVIDKDLAPRQRRIETQVLAFDGLNWNPYTYRWNEEQTDAKLVPAYGDEVSLQVADAVHGTRKLVYRIQSRDQCKICHHVFQPGALSFSPPNLTGESGSTRWTDLAEGGWVHADHGCKQSQVDPLNDSAPLALRARSYLDMNCAGCHAPAGAGLSKLDWQIESPLDKTASIDEPVLQGTFGLSDAKLIAPGHPERSVMMYRMATSGGGRMPHIGSEIPDSRGARLIWDWIASMEPTAASQPTAATEPGDARSGNTSDMLLLWHQLADLPAAQAVEMVSKSPPSATDVYAAGLLDPWMDPAKRSLTVGLRPDIAALIQIQGDAKRGASWFADSSGAQCRACHRHSGVGVALGPDLDAIGKRLNRVQLLTSLIRPSEQIDPQWRSQTVLLTTGLVVTGLVTSENDPGLIMKTTDGKLLSLRDDEIESVRENSQSLMPEGQLAAMTPQQVADLVEFLMK